MLWTLSSGAAQAHHRAGGPADGLAFASLTHGQLVVVAKHRAAILAVADRLASRDDTVIRLRNFADIQFMACLWGLVPGSLADEASPFNECSHAYLSATMALLQRLRGLPGVRREAGALMDRVALDMVTSDAASVVCGYTDEPFNTADVIQPRWADIPFHAPSLLSFGGVAVLALVGGPAAARRAARRRPVRAG